MKAKAKTTYTNAPPEVERALDAAIANGVRVNLKDLVPPPKKRVNIMLDEDIINFFKAQAKKRGGRYQTMINGVLSSYTKRAQSWRQ